MANVEGADFTARRKDTYNVTISLGGKPTRLSILPPTKAIHEGMVEVAGFIDKVSGGDLDAECDVDAVLSLVAATMSHNREFRTVSVADLEACEFDFDDIGVFLGGYIFFVGELTRSKN